MDASGRRVHIMKRSAHTLKPHHCRKNDGYIFSITTVDRSDPLRSQNQQREERGGSDFLIIIFSYNAGYAKYRGVKKPSFPGFRPFRRFLSLLGWLGRFFAFCTVVLFECIALYVWSAFCFTIVHLLSVKTFLTIAITFWFQPLIFFKSVQSAWFHQYIPDDFSRKVSEPLECP